MGKDFYTVKEFAVKVKVSPQSIYKRINKENDDIHGFIKKEGNKIRISAAAVSLYYEEPAAESREAERDSTAADTLLLDIIAQKDKEILRLLDLLDKANDNLKAAQLLHAADKAKIQELEAPKPTEENAEAEQKKKKGFFSWFRRKD